MMEVNTGCSPFNSVSLSFLICKMGNIFPTSLSYIRTQKIMKMGVTHRVSGAW